MTGLRLRATVHTAAGALLALAAAASLATPTAAAVTPAGSHLAAATAAATVATAAGAGSRAAHGSATPASTLAPRRCPTAPGAYRCPPAAGALARLAARRTAAKPFTGVVTATPTAARSYAAAGLNTVVLQAAWSAAQPAAGDGLTPAYLAQLRAAYAAYRAAGLQVILDPGLQYAPGWALALPGARFVDQYGDTLRASAASGEAAADAVWNPAVQAAEAGYLTQLGAAFGPGAFAAVRAGGLLDGELRYPTWQDSGHQNAIWDYSSAAQATSPVPGYRPGVSADDPADDAALVDHYLTGLQEFQDFLVTTTRTAFASDVQVLYPSWGLRPGDVAAALSSGLSGASPRFSELTQGLDFAALVARIPGYGPAGTVTAYTTWLDAPSGGTSAQYMTPVAYLVSLAAPLGVRVAGENTAASGNSAATLRTVRSAVAALHLSGYLWFDLDLGSASAQVTPAMIAG